MSEIKTTNEELMAIEMSYMVLTDKFLSDGFSPHACAAVMAKLAMMVYKSTLNANDYDAMINSISENRHMIKSFDEYKQPGRLN
jgi:hypothetical protein